MSALDLVVAELARAQHGVFSRAQVLASGASDEMIASRLRAGRWRARRPGVYELAGVRTEWRTELWTAQLLLGPASVVSHEAAGALHGFTALPSEPVTLTVPNGTHQRIDGWVVHQSRDLPLEPRWLGRSPGSDLVVTTPARTVLDLAAVLRPARLLVVVDVARRDGLLSVEEVAACLRRFARRGKPGVRQLGRVLDELGPGAEVPTSVLEGRLLRLLRTHDLPRPALQLCHPGRSLPGACVDAAYVAERIILEADGRRWHSRLQDMKRDRDRDAAAARAGWVTLRLLHEHITGAPRETAAEVRETLAVRRRQLRGAA